MPGILHRMYLQYDAAKDHCGLRTDSLEPGKLILEVKFTEMLPQLLRDVLPPPAAEFTAVSKYVLCYEKTRYMNGFEYWYET